MHKPTPASVASFLHEATKKLTEAGIATARLDAMLLLSDALGQDKSWLLAHPEQQLGDAQLAGLNSQLNKRLTHYPMAYLRGRQEFYGREFIVTPDVLIPKPESEEIISQLKELANRKKAPTDNIRVIDVGTGSGCLAITAALECPSWQVMASDVSHSALAVAQQNARTLHANVIFTEGDLLSATNDLYDVIIANLPYVSTNWQHSPESAYEPGQALFAANDGLALIKQLLAQVPAHLAATGHVILEADPRQHQAIIATARAQGLQLVTRKDFVLLLQRTSA